MDPKLNPYAPGAGSRPPEFAGREDILEQADIAFARIKSGRPAKGMFLLGLRGVGKTVLLNELARMAEEAGYKTAIIEAPESRSLAALLAPSLRQILRALDRSEMAKAAVHSAIAALRNFASAFEVKIGEFGVGVAPESGVSDTGDLETDLAELLLAVSLAAQQQDSAVALFIDEIQYLSKEDLAALIVSAHKISQRNLPLIIMGAGLPQIAGLAGEAKSYSERLFDFLEISALDDASAAEALTEPARKENAAYEKGAVQDIVTLTQGYPYFLQEWGYQTWNCSKDSPFRQSDVENATTAATQRLDKSFFRVRLDRLTPKEQDYLFAMARLGAGPHRSGDIAAELGREVQSVAPLRNGLIKKGMIYSPAHGETAFTVPLFDTFLKRAAGK